ncbi:uncharacterized protein CG7065 isoform X2 [Manduca sexta]|uniref:uncharacterized protein CG7065 isoform X2 n=1 Tax=Manduca sexta TaxID=7130 RepID=UPI0018903AF7|nr:uncharacterized protein CG7065 isoform X2 [Manduca sexta]
MDLPDCPPGAEGYEDTVVEMPKKPDAEENCTKVEQEFQEYLNSQKVVLENGESRCMVERRGRDAAGKWVYMCYPCSAICNGETVLQTHILGKKHKHNMSTRQVWPKEIFNSHAFNQKKNAGATDKKQPPREAEHAQSLTTNCKYDKYKNIPCELQDAMNDVKVPMLGVEYLIEFPPEQAHYKSSYLCTLCNKYAHPRTIINHMICFRHRYNYLKRHYVKATSLVAPYWPHLKYREGVTVVITRLAKRIEDTYGRMRPLHIDKDEFEKEKDAILQWIYQDHHFSENNGATFEEVVDVDLITTLQKNPEPEPEKSASVNNGMSKAMRKRNFEARDPSPPKVAAPSKPLFNNFMRSAGRQERRAGSVDSLSDISDDLKDDQVDLYKDTYSKKNKAEIVPKSRYEPYPPPQRSGSPHPRYVKQASDSRRSPDAQKQSKARPSNYEYKVKLAQEQSIAAEASAKKTFAYHEKNPEKHPMYPEEWKKFWNRRYKEIQAEGKDPSKHDFKPEWIQFWTKRMKEIHEDDLRIIVAEVYRKLCLTPPPMNKKEEISPELKRRSPEVKRRSPDPKWRLNTKSRRSPDVKRREARRRTPERRRSSERRRSPDYRRDYRKERKSPHHHHSPPRRRTPSRLHQTRSRSPHYRGSRSPLSRRAGAHAPRNRSPQRHSPERVTPSMQTVLISDDELKADDGLSPWNSADEMGSPQRSCAGSVTSRASRAHHAPLASAELGSTDNVVATLRLLVALEDHLGSLGPKVIDLLAEALKMEKEKANSSEELLVRESAVVLLETAKEKLKGAAQAGLVPPAAAAAVRAAVVRVAATLHDADRRQRREKNAQASTSTSTSKEAVKAAVPVVGVGEVDRAQIAQQMAAALVAQGKTDVSSAELAQLVDAVIGMAEAKKRETQAVQHDAPRPLADAAPRAVHKATGAVSALQMLQSAYDENKDKSGKDDGADAMDGLSDSDLETLLKNFNELSAEEQHSLIAYLKKLEAREPQRVERLRQYVSAAVATAPKLDEEAPRDNIKPVTIESDDDDYTVEEVFKSAKQKVKEDQIRQEMEIVQKSLKESNPPSTELPKTSTILDLTKSLSSASDLLALVQASIQSQAPVAPPSIATTAEVVHSNTQPKSFGDLPETQQMFPQANNPPPNLHHNYTLNTSQLMQKQNYNMGNNQLTNQQGFIRSQNNPMNYGGNRNASNDNYNQPQWNVQSNNMQEQRGLRTQGQGSEQRGPPIQRQQHFDNNSYNPGGFNQGGNSNFYNNRPDFETRPLGSNQMYGNFNPQNNFRGRGHYGGPNRGRGRGGRY